MASAYSDQQIEQYLTAISIPEEYRNAANRINSLEFLTALHVHQISTFPYENLALHYSEDATIDLEPAALFTKLLVDGRGRGGYCCELSIFMYHILRGLKFDAYMTGVRIRPRLNGIPQGSYMGW
jgi:arylamine N-acetyltransferase